MRIDTVTQVCWNINGISGLGEELGISLIPTQMRMKLERIKVRTVNGSERDRL